MRGSSGRRSTKGYKGGGLQARALPHVRALSHLQLLVTREDGDYAAQDQHSNKSHTSSTTNWSPVQLRYNTHYLQMSSPVGAARLESALCCQEPPRAPQ